MGKKSENPTAPVVTSDQPFKTCLEASQMFLHGAEEALKRAKEKWPKVEKCQARIQALFAKEERIRRRHAKAPTVMHEKLESIAIQLCDSEQYSLEQGFGTAAMECALVHILSAAAAESFINAIANERLSGQEWDAFDKLSIEGKWLFLPRLVKVKGFKPGEQPHQGFSKCVKYRNGLMH